MESVEACEYRTEDPVGSSGTRRERIREPNGATCIRIDLLAECSIAAERISYCKLNDAVRLLYPAPYKRLVIVIEEMLRLPLV